MKRRSLGELRYPVGAGDEEKAVAWAGSIVESALELVWGAFDRLVANDLHGINLAETSSEQLERELAQWHWRHVTMLWKSDPFAAYVPEAEAHELAARSGSNAMPPSNDLVFMHYERPTWKLPVEAKLLPSDVALAEYRKDLYEKFLPGKAAPFVGECGQVAYLLKGSASRVFVGIQDDLGQPLATVACFALRAHRTSTHDRATAPRLRVHHMVMSCVAGASP